MKTILKSSLIAIMLLVVFSCSKDDNDSSSLNETGQKLVGTWYFNDPSTSPTSNNSFTFTSDGKVTYRFLTINGGNNYDSETGTFKVEGDKLTMVYPQTVSLTFVQKVVFVTDKKVQFVSTGNPNEEPYDGTYYKVQ